MNKKAINFFDFFKSKRNQTIGHFEDNIDPLVEELRSFINEMRNESFKNKNVKKIIDNIKEVFYDLQNLKFEIIKRTTTKTAQRQGNDGTVIDFYSNKSKEMLKRIKTEVDNLSTSVKDDTLIKRIYETQRKLNNMIDNMENFSEMLKEEFKMEEISGKDSQTISVQTDVPEIFKRFIVSGSDYPSEGQMVDVEAIRGLMSTWIRKYGLKLIQKETQEYKSRYIPLEVFSNLINGKSIHPPDTKNINDRVLEPQPKVEFGPIEEVSDSQFGDLQEIKRK